MKTPAGATAYEKLNKLLKPGELKTFIDERCDSEFAWRHDGKGDGKGGMIVTWGSRGASAAASGAPAAASGASGSASASPNTGTPAAASGATGSASPFPATEE